MSVTEARRLRRTMSLPERLLWQRLRVATPKIRRQHPFDPFVLDFYCAAARVAIEVDGISHDMGDRPERDDSRISWLEARGLTVLRIAANDVLRDPVEVADAIVRFCRAPPPRR